MSYSRYNIVIIPPENIEDRSLEISSRFSNDGYFTLNQRDIFPHLSLYHIPLGQDAINETKEIIQQTVQGIPYFDIQGKEYRCHLEGWVGIHYEKTMELTSIHERILEALKSVWCREFAREHSDIVGIKGKNVQKYGWVDAQSRFNPHITLSRLKKVHCESVMEILHEYPMTDWSFRVKQVGLYDLGEHGTCTKLLQTFDLKRI